MLSVNQLTVSFGGRTLFDGISFLVQPRDRIGLVGKNGAGKSTLLKRLASAGKASDSSLSVRRELQIGYLPQDMEHQDGRTVLDEALTAFEQARAMEEELAKLEKDLTGLRGRLANPAFLASAREEVVDETRDKLEQGEDEAGKLRAALARLAELA
jgi:ATPase subunit of ABC transporter with duplicated ATPase domains